MNIFKLPNSEQTQMAACDNLIDVINTVDDMDVSGRVDVWLNLTNGIEATELLDDIGIPYKYCRFKSCSFESGNWGDALDSMPDDMLMQLALGNRQAIIDFGANKTCPRAMRQGIPIVSRMISIAWGLPMDKHMWIFGRDGAPVCCDDSFAKEAMRINRKQRNRLAYFGKFVTPKLDGVNITTVCAPTEHDGDYELHVKQAMNCYDGIDGRGLMNFQYS